MNGLGVRLHWTDSNAVTLLENGAAFFPALCDEIDAARVSIHLETYIFTLDRTGRKVLDCLLHACERGVKVRVVLDGFGSVATAPAIQARLRGSGAQCMIYRPEPHWSLRWIPARSRLRRLHRKLAVIDARVAFVGGINIVDDYDDLEPEDGVAVPRFDFAVSATGPMVPYVVYAQDLLWLRLNQPRLGRSRPGQAARQPRPKRPNRLFRRNDAPRGRARQPGAAHGPWESGQGEVSADSREPGVRAALALRDNVRYRRTFENAYLRGIQHARHDILIANAYFLPGKPFTSALIRAAERGVRVRVLVQGKIEYRMQYHATRALYAPLLEAGVEIIEYMPSYLHAKVVVIDAMAAVGSSNLDPFSFLLAREANVIVDDAAFAAGLRARLELAIERGGARIRAGEYMRRGIVRRFADHVSYLIMRIAIGWTGQVSEY